MDPNAARPTRGLDAETDASTAAASTVATAVAATTMTILGCERLLPSAPPPATPSPPLQRSKSSAAADSAAATTGAGPRVCLVRSSSHRQTRGGGGGGGGGDVAATSAAADLQLAGGTMGLLRRIGRRMVVYPAGRSRYASGVAAAPSAGSSGSQPHKQHGYSGQGAQESASSDGGSSSSSSEDASSGNAAANSGRPGLRPYRSFPAAALAAAAEAYINALYQYSPSYSVAPRHRRDPPSPSPARQYQSQPQATPAPSRPPQPPAEAAEDPSGERRSTRDRGVGPDALTRGSLPGVVVDTDTGGRGGLQEAGAGSPPQGPATPTAADAMLAAEEASNANADAANADACGADATVNDTAVGNVAALPLPLLDGAMIAAHGDTLANTVASSTASAAAAAAAAVKAASAKSATAEADHAEITDCYGTRSFSSDSCFSSDTTSSGGSSNVSCYSCETSAGGFSCGIECDGDGLHASRSTVSSSFGSSSELGQERDDSGDDDRDVVGKKMVSRTTDSISSIGESDSIDSRSDESSSRSKLVVLRPRDPTTPRPPPFTRYYPDGRSPSYKMSKPYRLLAQLTLGAYVGWPYMLLALAVAAIYGSMTAAVVLAVLVGTLLLPAPPTQWEALMTSSLFKLWRAYFNFSVLYEEMLDLTVPHIYVMSPHGVFPLSQILGGTLGGLLWPGHPTFCLAASCIFYIPIWRHIKSWMGAAPANRDTAMRLLTTQGSIAVLPGGIAEMFTQAEVGFSNRERIKMLGRRGFARLALETGAPIVPVYHFGNSQLLTFGPAAFQPLSRRLRIAIGTVLGVCGLPIPHPQPLFMCIGRPIRVPYTDPRDPCFEQRVEEVAEQVVDAYRRMYKQYGSEYGWSDRPLEVC